jgi:hypothetical protein
VEAVQRRVTKQEKGARAGALFFYIWNEKGCAVLQIPTIIRIGRRECTDNIPDGFVCGGLNGNGYEIMQNMYAPVYGQ